MKRKVRTTSAQRDYGNGDHERADQMIGIRHRAIDSYRQSSEHEPDVDGDASHRLWNIPKNFGVPATSGASGSFSSTRVQ
jgi:hypothetical protein